MKKGVNRSAEHVARQAPPLYIQDIKAITGVFSKVGKSANVFKAVTLIAYFSLLRQSNLVVTSLAGSSSHVLRMKDIKVASNKIYITVRSTKSSWKKSDQFVICIPAIPGSACCPVQAWYQYRIMAPSDPDLPVFWINHRTPLDAKIWVGAMRYALTKLKYTNPHAFSLHSLRRGAASTCILKGMEASHIKEAGRWKSSAVYSYIPKKMVKTVPAALTTFFG